jgi:hypothetical protein
VADEVPLHFLRRDQGKQMACYAGWEGPFVDLGKARVRPRDALRCQCSPAFYAKILPSEAGASVECIAQAAGNRQAKSILITSTAYEQSRCRNYGG